MNFWNYGGYFKLLTLVFNMRVDVTVSCFHGRCGGTENEWSKI